MAPPLYNTGGVPSSTSLTPTSDNRGIPLWKTQNYQSPTQSPHHPRPNGTTPRSRQPRPLTVNEALQYSPLTSIIPFDSGTTGPGILTSLLILTIVLLGIIPLPNTEIPTSQPLFSSPAERQTARQSLDLIDRSLANGYGQSDLANHTISMLQPLLNPNNISELWVSRPLVLQVMF